MVSPEALPAAHSPTAPPEAVLVLAAVIASRRVHLPSLGSTTSSVLLTVMVVENGVSGADGFGASAKTVRRFILLAETVQASPTVAAPTNSVASHSTLRRVLP